MTDSTLLFPHGFRLLDSDGVPVGGAQVRFFEVGLVTPKEVFSDADLSESLGSIVYTRSDGYLVSEQAGNTTVAVYIGSGRYGVDILNEDDVTIYPAKDDQQGAVDTSDFLTSVDASTLTIPTTAIGTNTTIGASHRGKLVNVAGGVTLTFTSPVTLGDGWSVRIRLDDTSGPAKLITSVGTFKGPGFNIAGIALYGLGHVYEIVCDGGNFNVSSMAQGRVVASGRIFTIADRVSSAPATTGGLFYIVTTAFSGFSIGDIIEGTGQATFIGYTPPTNSGWLAWVQTEGVMYRHTTAGWVTYQAQPELAADPSAPAADQLIWYPKDVGGVTHFFTQDHDGLVTDLSLRPDRAYAEYLTSEDLTTVLPYDDTKPQITEGVEKLSASITPKATTSRVRVTFQCMAGTSGAGTIFAVAALFQDSTADALQAVGVLVSASNAHVLSFQFEHSPATVAAVTYRVRVGPGSAGTLRLNGEFNARKFGGIARATLVVEEILA
jgi:hypothetical protein